MKNKFYFFLDKIYFYNQYRRDIFYKYFFYIFFENIILVKRTKYIPNVEYKLKIRLFKKKLKKIKKYVDNDIYRWYYYTCTD